MSAEDRTEQPTGKRLQDARKKGQIARTREAGQAASLIAAAMVLVWTGERFMSLLGSTIAAGIRRMGESATAPINQGEVAMLASNNLITLGALVGPVAVGAAITAVALSVAQGGWLFAPEALHANWGKLNPASGFKRLGLSTGGMELLRTCISVALVSVLSWTMVNAFLAESSDLARLAPLDAAARTWDAGVRLIKQTAAGLLLLAGADYFVKRYQHMKSLRMTKQEVKDENRMTQGNPEIKGRVRKIQREMFRRRMLTATKQATVVVTNPTHYAVALEYRRAAMSAPVIVAKGQGELAQRIKAIARERGIPMVENVPLARALYASAEVGDVIPGHLFEAVAEVLAYLIRIKQLVL